MLLPIHDRNPVVHIRFQIVTCLIIVACVLVFIWELMLSDTEQGAVAILRLSFVPARLFGPADGSLQPDILWGVGSIASSLFLHSGFGHLFGNMLFLWVFGDNIEDATGHGRFILFYLICGTVAALAQAAIDLHDVTPIIGASGAISGILGGYLMLHPHARILVMTYFFLTFRIRAVWLIGLWIAYQVVLGLMDDGTSHIAWWAHIGGFATGAALIPLMRRPGILLFDRDVGETAGHRQGGLARHQTTQIAVVALVIGVPFVGFLFFDLLTTPLALVLLGYSIYLLIQNLQAQTAHDKTLQDRREAKEGRRRSIIPRIFGKRKH